MEKDQKSQGLTQKKPVAPPPSPAAHCELLEKMRANPAGDWTIKDVETLCAQTGLRFKNPTRGSHHKVSAPGEQFILTVPAERPVKKPYIRQLVQMVDRARKRAGVQK